MTSNKRTSVINMEEEHLQKLVTEVKETIATDIKTAENKKFGITDLWNSQKNLRTTSTRRRYFPKSF